MELLANLLEVISVYLITLELYRGDKKAMIFCYSKKITLVIVLSVVILGGAFLLNEFYFHFSWLKSIVNEKNIAIYVKIICFAFLITISDYLIIFLSKIIKRNRKNENHLITIENKKNNNENHLIAIGLYLFLISKYISLVFKH
jgi:hypothetical protein